MTDIGTADEPLRFVGEELQLDVFDGSDPVDSGTRRWWFRSDLSVNNSDAVIRVNNNGEIVDVPVYEESTSVEAGIDTRFGVVAPSLSEPAFVPLTDPADAAFDFGRLETPDGTELSLHNRTAPGFAIPDSGDLHARFDATELALSDGNSVSTWDDETSNGYDLTAGTAPTYRTGIINGNPVVRFDGVDDYLDVAFAAISQPVHVFMVGQWRTTGNSNDNPAIAAESGDYFQFHEKGGSWRLAAGNFNNAAPSDTNAHIFGSLFDGASSDLRVDGASNTTDAGTNSLNGLTVGSNRIQGRFGDVDIGEILIYPQDKSGIASDVEQYLADKWGFTL